MNNEINLIASRRKASITKGKSVLFVRNIAISCLIFVIVLSISLFFYSRNPRLLLLERQEQTAVRGISFAQQKIVSLLLTENRLSDIHSLLSKRDTFETTLSDIVRTLPQGVSVDSLSINQKAISITVSSLSLTSLNTFLDDITAETANKHIFKKLTVNSLIADLQVGRYILSLQGDPL
jgi:Tfp pilus assembly protein PilN